MVGWLCQQVHQPWGLGRQKLTFPFLRRDCFPLVGHQDMLQGNVSRNYQISRPVTKPHYSSSGNLISEIHVAEKKFKLREIAIIKSPLLRSSRLTGSWSPIPVEVVEWTKCNTGPSSNRELKVEITNYWLNNELVICNWGLVFCPYLFLPNPLS